MWISGSERYARYARVTWRMAVTPLASSQWRPATRTEGGAPFPAIRGEISLPSSSARSSRHWPDHRRISQASLIPPVRPRFRLSYCLRDMASVIRTTRSRSARFGRPFVLRQQNRSARNENSITGEIIDISIEKILTTKRALANLQCKMLFHTMNLLPMHRVIEALRSKPRIMRSQRIQS